MPDKRDFTRVAAKATVWLIKDNKRYCHITGDISLGGIKIASPVPYRDGEILDIEFSIPDSNLKRPVRCKIAVTNVSVKDGSYFIHCYFFDIPKNDQERFSDAINNLIVEAWYIDEDFKKPALKELSNKREYSRVPLKMWITSKDIDESVHLPVENISSGGLYIITPVRHEPGTILEIAFHIPSKKNKIEAIVLVENIRAEGGLFGLGVKFIDLNDRDKAILEKSITQDITTRWFKK